MRVYVTCRLCGAESAFDVQRECLHIDVQDYQWGCSHEPVETARDRAAREYKLLEWERSYGCRV